MIIFLGKKIFWLLFLIFTPCHFDSGGHNSSYMYRLIADYYSADDLVIKRSSTGS